MGKGYSFGGNRIVKKRGAENGEMKSREKRGSTTAVRLLYLCSLLNMVMGMSHENRQGPSAERHLSECFFSFSGRNKFPRRRRRPFFSGHFSDLLFVLGSPFYVYVSHSLAPCVWTKKKMIKWIVGCEEKWFWCTALNGCKQEPIQR